MRSTRSWLAVGLLAPTMSALAQQAGSIVEAGNTQVSAMMMFLGNEEKVYILDKAENNAAQINGHPAWGAVYDIATEQTTIMDVLTNVFCASGMHLPNGSFVTFGGNGAVGPTGAMGSVPNSDGFSGLFDEVYQDYDGRRAIRVLNPCEGDDASLVARPECNWYDNATFLAMQRNRWYSAAEPLGDGSVAIIGGFVNGGYVNRNLPNIDPAFEGGAADPTYEFFPSKGEATLMQFMVDTSGLNSYAHTFLMPSGLLFLQANLSSMLWDPATNAETRLQDMPNGVVRVYPASGAVAMMPLTPANNWTPKVLFCGGTDMPADAYGNYSYPAIDTWDYVASADCHSITPEPTDGSEPVYVQEDNMLEPRTMGQFILLPDGTMMVVNGGTNGTAGYAQRTFITPEYSLMPFGESLATGPVFTPAIYDPLKPAGQRWSNDGLGASTIPRLYHSSAILLPDGSVLIAGSNPNVDVNLTTVYPTTYAAERFYPPYFAAKVRPAPQNVPQTISYGGAYFNVTVPASSYSGSANDAADDTKVTLMRPGFTTHAMNMGQRALQLNSTTSVNADGSLTVHVAQAPPNPNILSPGPCFLFVVVKGIPSNGTYVIVGNGQIGTQPTADASVLPAPVRLDGVQGGANADNGAGSDSGNNLKSDSGSSNTGAIIGGIVGAVVALGVIGAIVGIFIQRRRKAALAARQPGSFGGMPAAGSGPAMASRGGERGFVPLGGGSPSSASLVGGGAMSPPPRAYGGSGSGEYDPYYEQQGGRRR